MGTVKEIREWLEKNPEGGLNVLYLQFGGYLMKETLKALDHLESRGEITISSAVYKYGRKHGNEGREEKQTAIYNALRHWAKVSRVVPQEKILESSGAEVSYARRYLRFLAALGYVDERPTGWAVLEKAMSQAQPPIYNQRKEAANGGGD